MIVIGADVNKNASHIQCKAFTNFILIVSLSIFLVCVSKLV